MREDLLGFLLGALDSPQHDHVKRCLQEDPQLREQLLDIEGQLAPLESVRWDYEAPTQLAACTCEAVAQLGAEQRPVHEKPQPARTAGWQMEEPAASRSGWNLVDFVVAAGVSIAAAMLFFPAVSNSRYQAQLAACQNNLRMFGIALPIWADRDAGKLPYIPPTGKTGVAGYYAPQLMDVGLVQEHGRFLCPSSPLAAQRASFTVPQIETIQRAKGAKLIRIQRRMGGSYCYTLGHFERGQHRPTRLRGRTHFAVMSDHPPLAGAQLRGRLSIHAGRGLSVLFEDGHVRFIVINPKRVEAQQRLQPELGPWQEMFLSSRGVVEAGQHVDDAVLAPSWVRPIPGEADWSPRDLQLEALEF